MAHSAGGERGRARLRAGRAAASDLPADCARMSRVLGRVYWLTWGAPGAADSRQAVATLQLCRGLLQCGAETQT